MTDAIERLLDHLESLLRAGTPLEEEGGSPDVSPLAPQLGSDRRRITGDEPGLSVARTLPLALDCLREGDDQERLAAAQTLVQLGDAAIFALLTLLHDTDRRVRHSAAWALAKIRDRRNLPKITRAADWTYHTVREPYDPQAVPILLEALMESTNPTRAVILVALGRLSDRRPEIEQAVPELIEALCEDYPLVRLAAAWTLGRIGEPSAAPHLIDLLYDTDPLVGEAAAKALQALGTDEGLDAVALWRQSPGPGRAESAA